ncbi:hypothetical protein KAJ27_07265, partial [bacterium]|nr:hypothetical protein [bacterium]
SIGCSTGQEPYSIAMAAHEYVQANCFISKIKIEDFNILGIDISSDVLLKAESAQYNDIEIKRGISDERKVKYFNKEGNDWIIKEKIRDIVEFRKINIVKSFMMLEGFHIIFCRNILIYFDRETKQNILKQLLNILTDKGILIIGASENLFCLSDNFESRSFGSTLFFEKKMEA